LIFAALAPRSTGLLRFAPMPATFEDAFERVKLLAADFKAIGNFVPPPHHTAKFQQNK
jgi:hypothetical protein